MIEKFSGRKRGVEDGIVRSLMMQNHGGRSSDVDNSGSPTQVLRQRGNTGVALQVGDDVQVPLEEEVREEQETVAPGRSQ